MNEVKKKEKGPKKAIIKENWRRETDINREKENDNGIHQ